MSRARAVLAALLVACLAPAAAGCGFGEGDKRPGGGATLRVTRDFGHRELGSTKLDSVREGQTVMRMLRSEFDVSTRFGGRFVQSIDGLEGQGAGGQMDWFYCVRAGDCQRTLGLRASVFRGGVAAEVRGYDDAGDGIPIAGATVTASGVSGVTDAEGRVQLELHTGFQRLVARKDGLVRSFTKLVEVP